ncbi:MAG: hypothetical protein ACRDDY_06210 [Clostridium sp.]|uniref:hypothetical protein n=1 Tax=Clostridium sp. TaxID=1506 RepID=UPI003EE72629
MKTYNRNRKNVTTIRGCKHRKYQFDIKEAWSVCLLTNTKCSCYMPPSTLEAARELGCNRDYEQSVEYKIKTAMRICSGCETCNEYI